MKSAIVGLGTIGKVHLSVLRELNKQVVAVCDNNQAVLNDFSEYSRYLNYEKMLDEIRPDVVHICTPHYLHTQMIIKALERDVNVLCEKPLCITEEDIDLLIQAERNSKAQLGVCFQNRYNLTTLFVKDFLKDKQVISAHANLIWNRNQEYYAQDEWRGKKEREGGGVLINQAIHTLDLMQDIVGMPKEVIGWCSNVALKGVIDVEDTATVMCLGEHNFSLSASNTGRKDYPVELYFQTDNEKILVTGDNVFINGVNHQIKSNEIKYGKDVYGSGHKALIVDFYDCIKTGKKFSLDAKEGLKSIKIVLSAYKSKGKTISII